MRNNVKEFFFILKGLILTILCILVSACGIQINEGLINETSGEPSVNDSSTISIDQTDDDNSVTGFGGGNHTGTTYTSGVLTLNTTVNNSELDESWTPKWSNLVAYWGFDNLDGTLTNGETLLDKTLNGHDGILTGASGSASSVSTGRVNKYISFPSRSGDDYFIVNDSADLRIDGEISFMAWVNVNTTGLNWAYMIEKGSNDTSDNYAFFLTGSHATQKRISIEFNDSGGTYRSTGSTAAYECGNGWNHVALTYNDAANEIKYYYNGELVETATNNFSLNSTYTENLYIGRQNYTANDFEGDLDELAMWNTTLEPEDIKLIYERQSAIFSGEMKSRIMDSHDSNSQWTNLDWITALPFGKELPDSSGSESSSDYSSLVGSTGSTSDDDLMNGLISLWHLNEPSGTTGAGSIINSSSAAGAQDGTPNGPTFGNYGIFKTAAYFDGTNDRIDFGDTTSLELTFPLTIAAWINLSSLASSDETYAIISKYNAIGIQREWSFVISTTNDRIYFGKSHNGSTNEGCSGNTDLDNAYLNKWTYVSVTVDAAGNCNLYVNGSNDGSMTFANTTINTNNGSAYIGAVQQSVTGPDQLFHGYIDEVAIWSRELHTSEILQLYRRGANRIKYQVRSCSSDDCSDQDALTGDGWKGPGGNYLTYFSELYNNSSITSSCTVPQECYASELSLDGTIAPTSPSINFNSFGTDGLLGVDINQYFQYRVIMESDDENTACNSGTETCMPELKAVKIGPDHES